MALNNKQGDKMTFKYPGRPKGKSGANAHPLRTVIERDSVYELLECGHIIGIPRGFSGQYYSKRRRCKQCYQKAVIKLDMPQGN